MRPVGAGDGGAARPVGDDAARVDEQLGHAGLRLRAGGLAGGQADAADAGEAGLGGRGDGAVGGGGEELGKGAVGLGDGGDVAGAQRAVPEGQLVEALALAEEAVVTGEIGGELAVVLAVDGGDVVVGCGEGGVGDGDAVDVEGDGLPLTGPREVVPSGHGGEGALGGRNNAFVRLRAAGVADGEAETTGGVDHLERPPLQMGGGVVLVVDAVGEDAVPIQAVLGVGGLDGVGAVADPNGAGEVAGAGVEAGLVVDVETAVLAEAGAEDTLAGDVAVGAGELDGVVAVDAGIGAVEGVVLLEALAEGVAVPDLGGAGADVVGGGAAEVAGLEGGAGGDVEGGAAEGLVVVDGEGAVLEAGVSGAGVGGGEDEGGEGSGADPGRIGG